MNLVLGAGRLPKHLHAGQIGIEAVDQAVGGLDEFWDPAWQGPLNFL